MATGIGNQIPNPYAAMLFNAAGNGGGALSVLYRCSELYSRTMVQYAAAQYGSNVAPSVPAIIGGKLRCIPLTPPPQQQG